MDRILYHNDVAVCTQKVRLVLAEKKLNFNSRLLDLRAGDTHTPEFLEINPKGVVPVLIEGTSVITESTVINEYLEDAYPDKPLRSSDPLTRASMRRWVIRTDSGLLEACARVSFAIAFGRQEQSRQLASRSADERTAWEQRNQLGLEHPEAIAALKSFDTLISEMSVALSDSDWLDGSGYSLAECALLPYVKRLDDLALSWMWENDPSRSAFCKWYATCKSRASFKSAIDDWFDDKKRAWMKDCGQSVRAKAEQILHSKKV